MASVLAHAAVPLIARRAFDFPRPLGRKLDVLAVLCAIWPDLDYATLAFEVRPNELLGHRGLTHSLFVAVLVGLAASLAFRGARAWRTIALFLVGAAASHGLVDAMTTGDVGVALFAPLESGRHMLPLKLVATCPGGLDEWLGFWGLLTIANELLYIVLPVALIVTFVVATDRRTRTAMAAGVWLACVVMLRVSMPKDFRPVQPRFLVAADLGELPRDDMPDKKLVTRLDDLRPLLDKTLEPEQKTWSSSFFPTWFGGDAGRWMDGAPRLAWRTLFGFSPPTESEARAWVTSGDDRLFRLSPTEKLDIAFGHYDFPATRQALAVTHNRRPRPRYWSGRCNGIAAASIAVPEPFRVVDVIGKDGTHVRFHPNDVKSLLAVAYDDARTMTVVGDVCTRLAFDAGAACSMSPAVLVVAITNRIGLLKQSFLVDALPTIAKQYYAVASARVHVGEPREVGRTPVDPAFASRVARVVDAEIEMTLSSTTLPSSRADVKTNDPTRYQRVGLVPVVMKYTATLALDSNGEIVGGMWTGDPADGPDDLLVGTDDPALEGDRLAEANEIPWPFVRELARASADDSAATPTIDLRH